MHVPFAREQDELLLGEFGIDSVREGEARKVEMLSWQIEDSFRAGLAGTIVFISDGFDQKQTDAFVQKAKESHHQLLWLAIGTENGGAILGPNGTIAMDEEGHPLMGTFDADEIRNKKVDVLHALRPIPPGDVPRFAVRGQYGPGVIDGETGPQ